MNLKPDELIKQMTLEEKASLCSGLNFWYTKPIERLGIPSVMLNDGPHGLRKQIGSADHIGIGQSVPATCFPTAATTSCSFDRNLLQEIGEAIGEEMLQENIAVVLGPGVNIKRSPLCGRNFEYFSEDPLLAGELAAALVQGIQSQGVGACLKHYAANNQETARMINDSIVDERALREIYLSAFEIAVKKSNPWTMMCAYNKLNGTYTCEHEHLLNEIPRGEWGFEGLIMTDWGAMDDRVWALKSGLDLEMPYSGPQNDQLIIDAVRSGELDEEVLDRAAIRLVEIVQEYMENEERGQAYDLDAHDDLARRAVCESAVLLKNEAVLPLKKGKSVAIIGEFAEKPRYQGAGSSNINPHKITNALKTLDSEGVDYVFAKGYDLAKKEDPDKLIEDAIECAKDKDSVVIFSGLPDEYESEGFDRTSIDLPYAHNLLIEKVAEINPNVIIVLHTGSAVCMPWIDKVKAVLLLGLGGQCVGAATVDLLTGKANPSGKLSETYPIKLVDNPSFTQFGKRQFTEYRESVYVGYRYYEKAKKQVLFPFGHGLSYTQFEYDALTLSHNIMRDDETLSVSLKVKNTGNMRGKEVVQIYVSPPESSLFKPEKELRAFEKLLLEPGEEKEISVSIDKRAFAYWNTNIHDWHVESGVYEILIGSSSADIRLRGSVVIQSIQEDVLVPDFRASAPIYYNLPDGVLDVPQEQFAIIYGKTLPEITTKLGRPFTRLSTLYDTKDTLVGKFFINTFRRQMRRVLSSDETQDEVMMQMMEGMMLDFPLRSFGMMGMSRTMVDGILDLLNGKFLRGLKQIIAANQKAKNHESEK